MRYLFFDIECSVVSKTAAKICAFGYCLTDEKFHIIEKEDLLVNPQGGFHLTDRKGAQGLVLPYKYEEFKQYPTFPERAEKIYALLQDRDTLVIGHATMNDVKYLNLENKRFDLPPLRFAYADTQFLYMHLANDFSRQFGLGAIAEQLGVEFVAHRAVDDAYATMRVAEAMCKAKGNVSLKTLLDEYEIELGKIENYEIELPSSTAFKAYKKEQERKKEARERQRAEFHVFVDKEKRRRAKVGKLRDKKFCFSHVLELETELAKGLLKKAFAQGGFYTYHAEECDLYVCFETESGLRRKSAEGRARIFTPEEFEKYISE